MEMERVEVVVVGGGVIGLAIARELSLRGREVLLLEAEAKTGTGISSRNSEVIHAGLYYPTGSLRARLCVEGNRELYAYCQARGVGHARLGKLIVATETSQEDKLAKLLAQARENHVHDVVRITAAEAQALEPALLCTAALLSPSTGIVDSHALMEALRVDAIEAGCSVVCGSPLSSARVTADGFTLQIGGDEPIALSSTFLINAAGLGARAVGLSLDGLPTETVPRLVLAKGNYYGLEGVRSPFARLVYPLPEPGGLGVHLTLDLAGQARFGPDVEWIDTIDYAVDPTRAEAFYASVRRYWPALPDGALAPAYAGIRPKLTGPGEPPADFLVQGEAEHGVPGYLALHGIESPGLTCCLPLARHLATHLP